MLVASSCGTPACVERRHASGIALVCTEDIEPWKTASEELKAAVSFAFELAEANPDLFGYPAPDFAKGELIVRIARPGGESISREWIASGVELTRSKANRSLPRPGVRVRLEPATRSFGELARIQHDVGPNLAALPDSNAIYQSGPDFGRNATRFVIDHESDALLRALAARYGTAALVVEVNAKRPIFRTQ